MTDKTVNDALFGAYNHGFAAAECSISDTELRRREVAAHETREALRARVRELEGVVQSLARHDPRPTTEDGWCYFCGEHLTPENGHNADACLWVRARALLPDTAEVPA